MRGRLTLTPDEGSPLACGAEYFAAEPMPRVFAPICAQCHVAGGLAQGTRLRVTAGDPVATARTAIGLVDPSDPTHSLLLLKPRGDVPHGGGRRITPGSAEELALQQWIGLVTAPDCQQPGGGGGGGPTGDPYVDNCAACHGPDARGLAGRPDIHCNRSIHDVVRNGRTGPAGTMPAFPALSEADIATIQQLLLGLCPPGTASGEELYAGNCATCHGGDAGGVGDAPSVRCATRVADALEIGRGTRMSSFPTFVGADLTSLTGYLAELCLQHGRTPADLWAGNCSSCHGATAGGGRNGLGVRGPNVRCTGANDYREKVAQGDDDMPSFPALDPSDVDAIAAFVHGSFCSGD
jgi:mono/diheme cytochrome c family protein